MNPKLLDFLERVGWTFLQAVAGSVAAGGTAVSLGTFDWRAALIGGGTAAGFAALKVLGVNASVAAQVASGAVAAINSQSPVQPPGP